MTFNDRKNYRKKVTKFLLTSNKENQKQCKHIVLFEFSF